MTSIGKIIWAHFDEQNANAKAAEARQQGDETAAAAADTEAAEAAKAKALAQARMTCKLAAMHAIQCPSCGDILDQGSCRVFEVEDRVRRVLCPKCAELSVTNLRDKQSAMRSDAYNDTIASIRVLSWKHGYQTISEAHFDKPKKPKAPRGTGKKAFTSVLRVLETHGKKGQSGAAQAHLDQGLVISYAFWLQLPPESPLRAPTGVAGERNRDYECMVRSVQEWKRSNQVAPLTIDVNPQKMGGCWGHVVRHEGKPMTRTFVDARYLETIREFTDLGGLISCWATEEIKANQPLQGQILILDPGNNVVAGVMPFYEREVV